MAEVMEFVASEDRAEVRKMTQEGYQVICTVSEHVDGAAETIAKALNFQDRAQELLVQAAAAMRQVNGDAVNLNEDLAAEIEEFLVNG